MISANRVMMDKFFHFMYVPSDNAAVRNVRIRRATAFIAIGAISTLVILSILMVVKFSGHMRDSLLLAELESENEALRARVQAFQVEVDELEERMEANFELQNRARMLAGLDPIDLEVWQVGVGGPEPLELESIGMTNSDMTLSNLDDDLERMVRQSKLQLDSYGEIIGILEQEKKVRDCTPSIRPLRGGYLSSRFGRRMDPFTGRISRHTGVDYRARNGTPAMTTADGIVTMAKKNGSFGLMIEVDHGFGFKTRYAHLSKMLVRRGSRVKRGEIIGLVGTSGRSTGSHLHYEVMFKKANRDPLHYVIPSGTYFD
jgi:murein DD-endopeptidase MepM/ murein hydrolase activator NlpD